MLRALGVGLIGLAAWLGWGKAAFASAPADSAPGSDPLSPDVPVPAGPAAFYAIARQVNQDEFGGFFGDCSLVMGVMQTESSFNPRAYRFEPHLGEASYGLMQLLESTARDRGLSGPATELYDPVLNIRLGMRQLKWSYDFLAAQLGTFSQLQWISSYNMGVGNVLKGRTTQTYYGKVTQAAAGWVNVA